MANVIRIKRRVSGVAGAPSALKSAELAHNEVDDTLYVGKGDDGSGNATSVVALAGRGAFVDLANAQTVSGRQDILYRAQGVPGCLRQHRPRSEEPDRHAARRRRPRWPRPH